MGLSENMVPLNPAIWGEKKTHLQLQYNNMYNVS